MGGQTSSTPQIGASPMGAQSPVSGPMGANMPLSALFMGNSGYQQTPVPQIHAPQYPTATWTPQQAQAQTLAQMNALRPYVQPPAPAKPQQPQVTYHGGSGHYGG